MEREPAGAGRNAGGQGYSARCFSRPRKQGSERWGRWLTVAQPAAGRGPRPRLTPGSDHGALGSRPGRRAPLAGSPRPWPRGAAAGRARGRKGYGLRRIGRPAGSQPMGVRRDEVMPGPRRVGGARGPAGRARSFAPHPLLTFDLGVPRLQPQPPLPGQAPVRGGNPEASCLLRALVSPSARWGRESAAARPAARALGSPGSFGSLPAPGPPRAVPSAPRGGAGWARRAPGPGAPATPQPLRGPWVCAPDAPQTSLPCPQAPSWCGGQRAGFTRPSAPTGPRHARLGASGPGAAGTRAPRAAGGGCAPAAVRTRGALRALGPRGLCGRGAY